MIPFCLNRCTALLTAADVLLASLIRSGYAISAVSAIVRPIRLTAARRSEAMARLKLGRS